MAQQTSAAERLRTLPVGAFCEQEFLAREFATLWRNTWLLVPKIELRRTVDPVTQQTALDALALRGNSVLYQLAGESIILKRGFEPKGNPRVLALTNRCPHAFYPL